MPAARGLRSRAARRTPARSCPCTAAANGTAALRGMRDARRRCPADCRATAPSSPRGRRMTAAGIAAVVRDAAATRPHLPHRRRGDVARCRAPRARATRCARRAPHAAITEYVPGDLTLTARAGTSLAELHAATRAHGQRLALDPYRHRRRHARRDDRHCVRRAVGSRLRHAARPRARHHLHHGHGRGGTRRRSGGEERRRLRPRAALHRIVGNARRRSAKRRCGCAPLPAADATVAVAAAARRRCSTPWLDGLRAHAAAVRGALELLDAALAGAVGLGGAPRALLVRMTASARSRTGHARGARAARRRRGR